MNILLLARDDEDRAYLGAEIRQRGHALRLTSDPTLVDALIEPTTDVLMLDLDLIGDRAVPLVRDFVTRPDADRRTLLLLAPPEGVAAARAVLEAGADDCLIKRIAPALLDIRLLVAERHVAERRARLQADAALAAERDLFHALLEHAPANIYVKDAASRFVRVNRECARFLGVADPAEVVGKSDVDFFPPALARHFFEVERRIMESGEPMLKVLEPRSEDPRATRWTLTSKGPIRDRAGRVDGIVGISWDVTDEQNALEAVRRSEERYRTLLADATRHANDLELLLRLRERLTGEVDVEAVIRTVVEESAATFGYTQVSLYLLEGTELVLRHQVGYQEALRRIPITRGVVGRVARSGEPELLPEVGNDSDFLGALEAVRSEIAVPLRDQGRVVGVFNVESRGDRVLDEADLRLISAVAGHVSNALARARLNERARESDQRFRSAFAHAPVGMAIVGLDGRLIEGNAAFSRMLGYEAEDLVGMTFQEVTVPEDLPADLANVERLIAGEIPWYAMEKRYLHREGRIIWGQLHVTLVHGVGGEPRYFVAQVLDITERKSLEQRLRHMALHDPLTRLPNRALFMERLQRALEPAGPAAVAGLLYLDIDDFKDVNDTLGHEAGDLLLEVVAERLRRAVRRGDTAARLSGDEFTVLLHQLTDVGEALQVAERVLSEIARPVEIQGRPWPVTLSIGIAIGRTEQTAPDELLRMADRALYQAKAAGKNRYALFAPERGPSPIRGGAVDSPLAGTSRSFR